MKPKKRVAEETGLELTSDEEMAQFCTVRSSKKQKESLNDSVKQSCNKNQNTNKAQNHNQVKKRIEQRLIQQVESEAPNLGSEGTIVEGKTWEKVSRATKKDNSMTYILNCTIKGHLLST
jgi:hypothetical protein